jgi:hypothetical protein
MRYLIFMALFALTACHKPIQSRPVPTTAIASLGSMRVAYPLTWENQLKNENQSVFLDQKRHGLLLLSKEECKIGYANCMVLAIRGIAQAGFTHLSADDVMINEIKYVHLVSDNGRNRIWTWLSWRDENVYILTCGGMEIDPTIEQDCVQIGSTLQVYQSTSI